MVSKRSLRELDFQSPLQYVSKHLTDEKTLTDALHSMMTALQQISQNEEVYGHPQSFLAQQRVSAALRRVPNKAKP
ncbi:hypothetical protein DNTS_004450 [Danionella cerebrum]|uniref:Uncharacterized protein n=1 Tax=Danionella cerebrum TaxID=2873325 RepID=A0A553PZB4_9TELE|nr:hypothetical protein DNTS_004450 [Danionella translucida]